MAAGKSATYLGHELAEQPERVVVRLPDALKLIAGRATIAQLECIDGHAGTEKSRSKPKLALNASSIHHADRVERHMFKRAYPKAAGSGLVEASTAELLVAALD